MKKKKLFVSPETIGILFSLIFLTFFCLFKILITAYLEMENLPETDLCRKVIQILKPVEALHQLQLQKPH